MQTVAHEAGWTGLFWEAFRRSKNAMMLLDDRRCLVEVNGAYLSLSGCRRSELIGRPVYERVAGGPLVSTREWRALLGKKEFTGTADLVRPDGGRVTIEVAAHPEIVTGRQLVLFVVMRAASSRRPLPPERVTPPERVAFSRRELEVIGLLGTGLTGPEVAGELQLAHNTVRTHVRNAMSKSGARSRAQLVAVALAEGLYWRGSPE
jgi:PAS domain S-box-containing protein